VKILCVFGKHNYGNPKRGIGYEYANFIPALRNLGYETVFFESWDKSAHRDFADLNRKLLTVIEQEQPDIVFCVTMSYEIWLETIELARAGCHAAFIHWAADDSWKYEQCSRLIAPVFDVMVTTYPSAMKKAKIDGFNHFRLTQWAANSSVMRQPLPAERCRYQVSFVGTAYGNRFRWIKKLKARGIDVTCFGYGWPNGPVESEEIPRIIRESFISLNFGDSGVVVKAGKPMRSRQIKARVFEVPGAGGVLATECAEHLEEFFIPGSEIIVFEDANDLAKKVKYLLANTKKRDAIAQAGFARTKDEHSYEARFKPIIEQSLEQRKTRKIRTCGINFDHFEAVTESHQLHFLLRFVKLFFQLPCMLIWGPKRGPRAARRFLFELSWRLAGQKTYRASGWPGKIFYRES